MKRLLSICVFAILFAAAPAFGQTSGEPVPGVGFHCWIGTDGAPLFTRRIRCIADRELRLEEMPDMESPNIIDLLHRELHFGSGVSTEKAFKANIERVREDRRSMEYPYFYRPLRLILARAAPAEAGQCRPLPQRYDLRRDVQSLRRSDAAVPA